MTEPPQSNPHAPRVSKGVPNLLITQGYSLDEVQQGSDDQTAGSIIHSVVTFDWAPAAAWRRPAHPRWRLNPSGMTRSSRWSWWIDACPSPRSADSMPPRMMSSTFSTPACPLAARPQR